MGLYGTEDLTVVLQTKIKTKIKTVGLPACGDVSRILAEPRVDREGERFKRLVLVEIDGRAAH